MLSKYFRSISIFIWVTFLKKAYHRLMPRTRVKIKIGDYPYFVNLNDHISFIGGVVEEKVKPELEKTWGNVWDVGSNFGIFSIIAAHHQNQVVAFDLSSLALDYLSASAKLNLVDEKITTVAQPLTVSPISYEPIDNAFCTNQMETSKTENDAENSKNISLTYLEAGKIYGIPNLIKMDIEGGEKEFLESKEFLSWVKSNRISLIVELHYDYTGTVENMKEFFKSSKNIQISFLDTSHLFLEWQ